MRLRWLVLNLSLAFILLALFPLVTSRDCGSTKCTREICFSSDTWCKGSSNNGPCCVNFNRPSWCNTVKGCRVPNNGCYCDEVCDEYGDCCSNRFSVCFEPSLAYIRPANGPTNGLYTITLTGKYFRTGASVILNGQSVTRTYVSDTEMRFTMPAGINPGHEIKVYNSTYNKYSLAVKFDYDAPLLQKITPTTLSTAGGQVTLEGTSLGKDGAFDLRVNEIATTPLTRDHQVITFNVPPGVGPMRSVRVTVGTQGSNTVFFSYNPPTLTSVSTNNSPTTGGGLLTINGNNFGPSGYSVTIGGTNCPIQSSTPHTRIVCTIPPGAGVGNQIRVTDSAGQATTSAISLNYDAPVIDNVTPLLASTGGNVELTITGKNFYTQDATVAIGSLACAVTSNTHTQIKCLMPPGEGEGMSIRVSQTALTGSYGSTFSYKPPTITSVTPSAGSTQGNTLLTIDGDSFGTTGFVTIAGQTCNMVSRSHTRITCRTLPGMSTNLAILVTVLGRNSASTPFAFSYLPPSISSLNPSSANTEGGVVLTISGANFATSGSVTVGGLPCPPTDTAFSHTTIKCVVPSGSGAGKEVKVTVGGQTTSVSNFGYNGPSITSITPSSGPTGGSVQITLQGNSFGSTGGSVLVGTTDCPVVSQTHNVIICILPVGSGTVNVRYTVDGQNSNQVSFVYAPPEITQVSPTSGTTEGGTTLVITGTSFATSGTVTVDGNPCAVTAWSHTQVTCTTPPGVGAARVVRLTVPNYPSTPATGTFAYTVPTLTSITPSQIKTDGTTLITLTGTNFGASAATGTISVSSKTTTVVSWAQRQIVFRVNEGQGQGLLVSVTVGGQVAANTLLLSYLGPKLTSVSPDNGPTQGSTSITLTGADFGLTPSVAVGALNCPVTFRNHTHIICNTPAGQGQTTVQVSVASQVTSSLPYYYNGPTLSGVSPSNGPTAGGTTLVISGSSLGTFGTVTVGGQTCAITSHSHTEIRCTTAAGEGTGLQIQAMISNQGSNFLVFNYDAPTVSSVTPNQGNTTGGYPVVVAGNNFGVSGQVRINSAPCPVVSRTHTSITCTMPSGTGATNPMTVVVGARTSATSTNFAYDLPIISTVAPQNIVSAGGSPITLTGNNFGTSGSVTVDGNVCFETGTGFQHTSIVCTLPASQGVNRPVVVTVGGQQASSTYTYLAPSITSITPTSADTGGNVPITISGTSLGYSGTVTVGGQDCPVAPGSWTHVQVVCTLPPGQATVSVTLTSAGRSASQSWSYNGPAITTITPNIGPTIGEIDITVSGSSFDVSGTVTIGGSNCPIKSWAHNSIVCSLPPGDGLTRTVAITTTAGATTSADLFSYEPPSISDRSPDLGVTQGGTILSITGTNFGVSTPIIEVGGLNCPVLFHNQTLVRCTAPGGTGLGKLVRLNVSSQISNTVFFGYQPPTLTSVSPSSGVTAGAYTILVTGSNFGPAPEITIGGNPCALASPVNADHTQVTCTVPPGQGTNRAVQVNVASQLSTSTVYFSYVAPNIASISAPGNGTAGGTPMVITGTSFGTSGIVTVGTSVCPPTSYTHDRIECTLPAGEGANVAVRVAVGALTSNTVPFTYPGPIISSINPPAGPSSGQITVTIKGTNFGITGFAQLNGMTCISQGGVIAHEEIQCTLPAGSGINRPMIVTVAGQTSPPYSFSYDPPTIQTVNPSTGPTAGGTLVTISGISFTPAATATIGGKVCAAISATQTYSSLQCQLPPGMGKNLPVIVTVDGQPSASALFSYLDPSISTIAPSNSPTAGQRTIVINGNNFGTDGTVTIANKACNMTGAGWTHNRIECITPSGRGLGQVVNVTTAGQQSVTSSIDYDAPIITAVANGLRPATKGGDSLVLTGTNFGYPPELLSSSSSSPSSSSSHNLMSIQDDNNGMMGLQTGSAFSLLSTPSDASMTVAGKPCPITAISDTEVTCTTPEGTSVNQPVVLTVAGRPSASFPINYAPPLVDSISGCDSVNGCPVAGGIRLTIHGQNLGSTTSSVATVFIADSLECENVAYATPHEVLSCDLPERAAGGYSLKLTVTVGGQVNVTNLVSYAGPKFNGCMKITGLTDPVPPTCNNFQLPSLGPFSVVMNISDAEPNPIITYGPTANPTMYPCTITNKDVQPSYSIVTCTIEQGAGANMQFIVKAGLQTSIPSADTVTYPKPAIVAGSLRLQGGAPANIVQGVTTEGEYVQFAVNNLPTSDDVLPHVQVNYGPAGGPYDFRCTSITRETVGPDRLITCRTQPGSGGPYVFVLTANGQASNPGTDTYTYPIAPIVESVHGCTNSDNATTNCPTFGGVPLTIDGQHFPNLADAVYVYVGSSVCTITSFVSVNRIICTLPPGRGVEQSVVVVNGQLWSRAQQLLSYAVPQLTEITGCPVASGLTTTTNCPRNGGINITLTGTSFGADGAMVLVGGVPCTNLVHDPTTPHTKVKCLIPEGTGNLKSVILIQGQGSISANTVLLSYLPCAAGEYAVGSTTVCSQCEAGTITSTTGQSACTPCEAGTYATGLGNTACLTCDAGTFSGTKAGQCSPCTPGYNAPDAGSGECAQCAAGKYSYLNNAITCLNCPQGTSQPDAGKAFCVGCPRGHYQALEGQGSCLPCAIGSIAANLNSTSCTPCTSGKFQASQGQSACEECPKRTSQSLAGQNGCIACDDGKYQNLTGQISCVLCERGKYVKKIGSLGAEQCIECPRGRYQAVEGQNDCLDCPLGRFNNHSGQSVCESCPLGKFQDAEAQSECKDCTPGTVAGAIGTITCSDCNPGYFQNETTQSQCMACPAGTYQGEGGQSGCIPCAKGTANALIGQLQCSNCLDGTMANTTGNTECTPCGLGSYSKRVPSDTTGPQSCTPCVAGYHADSVGTVDCSPCEPGYSTDDQVGLATCTICPAGTWSGSAAVQCTNCTVGRFSKDPGSLACTDCQAGTFAANQRATGCDPCQAGTAQPDPRATGCNNCTAGYFTEQPQAATCSSCPAGRFGNETAAHGCYNCPVGKVQPDVNRQTCVDCPDGQYQDAQGQITCKPCSAGSFTSSSTPKDACTPCAQGKIAGSSATVCSDCALGKFALGTGSLTCDPCDAGSFANTTGSITCTKCSPGTYQGSTEKTVCDPCPVGRFIATEGASECLPCTIGTFNNLTGQTRCTPCPAGTMSAAESSQCTPCSAGKYALGTGNFACTDCEAGKYASNPGASMCTECEAGKFRSGIGASICDPCEIGKATAAIGQASCTKCGQGRFANTTGLSICIDCGPGTYAFPDPSATAGAEKCSPCDIGKYQSASGQSGCVDCSAGSYSPTIGRISCEPCEAGKFQGDTGKSECKNCTAGSATASTGSVLCPPCDSGKYASNEGNLQCTSCDPGKNALTTGLAICTPCTQGKYASSFGSVECVNCEIGKYSNGTGSAECTQCEFGKFQEGTQKTTCDPCPPGRFGATRGLQTCVACELGSATSVYGSAACTQCAPGSHAPTTARQTCVFCDPGKSAVGYGAFQCNDCEPGRYAPHHNTSMCLPCPEGSSQIQPGSTFCEGCEPGKFATNPASPSCTDCPLGTFMFEHNATQCTNCQPGKFSSSAAAGCQDCAIGHEAPNERSITCTQCTVGSIANVTGSPTCTLCPLGKFQAGLGKGECEDCPLGFFAGTRGQGSCDPCLSGEFANTTGLSACYRCPAGSYSRRSGSNGPTSCAPCETGTYQPTEGQSICPSCPVGSYANGTGKTTCERCAPGSFADVPGRSLCLECPAGYATGSYGTIICPACVAGKVQPQRNQTSCIDCTAGFYQPDIGQQQCIQCPQGTFAENPGQAVCSECMPGTIGPDSIIDAEGEFVQHNKSYCIQCSSGTHQDLQKQTSCNNCTAGHFALEPGRPLCDQCPPGTYSGLGQSRCTPCEAGKHQPNQGQTGCVPCGLGKFMGSPNQAECDQCPPGRFGNREHLTVCDECLAGTATPLSGQTKCATCVPGKFALAGQPECRLCSDGQATNNHGSSECVNCGALAISSQDRSECLCIVGYYLPSYKQGSNQWNCVPCVEGADCTQVGTTWFNLKALPGYWRPSNTSLTFVRCAIPEQCTGGAASAAAFAEDGSSGSGCAENRAGIACKSCAEGYRPSGVVCVACPEGDIQWVLLAVLAVLFVALIAVSAYIVIRSGEKILEKGISAGAGPVEDDDSDDSWEEDEDDDYDEEEDHQSQSRNEDDEHREPSQSRQSGDGSDDQYSDESARTSHNHGHQVGVTPYAPPSAPPPPSDPDGVEMAELGTESARNLPTHHDDGDDHPSGSEFSDSDFVDDDDSEEANVAVEARKADLEWAEKVKLIGPPPPVANFTYKFKIFLSFLQITNSITSTLDFRWPETYKNVMSFLGLTSIDALIDSVAGTDCFTQDNYYIMYVVILSAPIAMAILILLIFALPNYLKNFCFKSVSNQERLRAKLQTWRVFLYFLFLIFPIVSSKVLRHYICDTIDGTAFLASDYRVKCYTDLWNLVSYVSTNFILLYPIGIPVFFFVMLRRHRHELFSSPAVKAQLGFLYLGYKAQLWWWEILDSLHKLFLVAIIAFFPGQVQLPVGMSVAVLYLISLLLLNPYQDPSDDLLHQFAQTEIFLVILAGYLFESFGARDLDTLEDIGLSVVLLLVTFGFIILFLLFAGYAIVSTCKSWAAKREARKAREAVRAARREEKEMKKKNAQMLQEVNAMNNGEGMDQDGDDNRSQEPSRSLSYDDAPNRQSGVDEKEAEDLAPRAS